MSEDPKSPKMTVKSSVTFFAFGICSDKNFAQNIDEIDTRSLSTSAKVRDIMMMISRVVVVAVDVAIAISSSSVFSYLSYFCRLGCPADFNPERKELK